jgi:hypothetical protein
MGPGHAWLAQQKGFFGTLQGGVARVLRWVGHALIASPVLVLLYWSLRSMSPLLAGWVVVLFVCTVVAFFAALKRVHRAGHDPPTCWTASSPLALWSADEESQLAAEKLLFPEAALGTRKTGQVISIGAPADGGIVVRRAGLAGPPRAHPRGVRLRHPHG